MPKSRLCDYSDSYILVEGTINVPNSAAADADASNADKKAIFKNCPPFINCMSEINNTQVANAKDIDIIIMVIFLNLMGLTLLVNLISKEK